MKELFLTKVKANLNLGGCKRSVALAVRKRNLIKFQE
jgi:hypothetical protein